MKTCQRPCPTCPWLKANQGKRHPSGWYTKKNLLRLFQGMRTGEAPGMVCHATDPESVDYGATKAVPASSQPRECAGFWAIVQHHIKTVERVPYAEYKKLFAKPFTRRGLFAWVERIIFAPMSGREIPVVDKTPDIGVPWEAE